MSRNIIIVWMYHRHTPLDLKRNISHTHTHTLTYMRIHLYMLIHVLYIYMYILFLLGCDWAHLVLRPLFDLLHQPRDDRWWWVWSSWWNENWQGKPKYLEKTCRTATLSTTNPTWPEHKSSSREKILVLSWDKEGILFSFCYKYI
jgi:hypothetical protein